jgi:hypothetical protein
MIARIDIRSSIIQRFIIHTTAASASSTTR